MKASHRRYTALSETPASLLEQARSLFHDGYLRAALMLCRLAVEKHLRQLAKAYGVYQQHSLDLLVMALRKAGHFAPVEHREIRHILKHCNKAAHGDPFTTDMARTVLASAQGWLDLHTLPRSLILP